MSKRVIIIIGDNMEKGFTLIELLAVIVILAIIALIATPIVLNIIDDVRTNADVVSRDTYINEVERALVIKSDGHDFSNSVCNVIEKDTDTLSVGDLMCDGVPIDVNIKGTMPTKGTIIFVNGKAAIIKELTVGNSVFNKSGVASGLYDLNGAYIKTWQDLITEELITIQDASLKKISEDMEGMLVIDDTITSIAYSAGSNCNLSVVVMPDSITSTVYNTFAYCRKLKAAILSTNLERIDYGMFTYTDVESIIVPEGVTEIDRDAFRKSSIKNVSLPSTLTTIGMYAFSETSIESVVIPENVTSIGWAAFRYNDSLKSVKLMGSQTDIGAQAFYDTGIEDLYVKGGTFGNNAFAFCSNIKNVVIDNGVTALGYGAFMSSSIDSITLPDSLTLIDDSVFYNSTLESITIPAAVTSIGMRAFAEIDNLTDVYFESPTNWKAGETPISSTELANSKTAATYLKGNYSNVLTKSE